MESYSLPLSWLKDTNSLPELKEPFIQFKFSRGNRDQLTYRSHVDRSPKHLSKQTYKYCSYPSNYSLLVQCLLSQLIIQVFYPAILPNSLVLPGLPVIIPSMPSDPLPIPVLTLKFLDVLWLGMLFRFPISA